MPVAVSNGTGLQVPSRFPQQASVEKIVAKFGVTRGKPTPMVVGLRLDEFDPEEAKVEESFRSLVGHLM